MEHGAGHEHGHGRPGLLQASRRTPRPPPASPRPPTSAPPGPQREGGHPVHTEAAHVLPATALCSAGTTTAATVPAPCVQHAATPADAAAAEADAATVRGEQLQRPHATREYYCSMIQ